MIVKNEWGETKKNLKMSWHFLKKQKKNLFLGMVLSVFLSVISIIVPILSAQLLLKLTNGLYSELIGVVCLLFVVELTRNIVSYFFKIIADSYLIDTVVDVQLAMARETLHIAASEIDKNTSGTFIDRINNDTADIINIFTVFSDYLIDILTNIGIVVAIFIISPYMFCYFVITSIILGWVDRKRRDFYYNQNKKIRTIREKRTGIISELVRGVKDIRLLNAEEGMLKKTNEQLKSIQVLLKNTNRVNYKFNFFYGDLRDLFDVLFFVLGIVLVSIHNLTASNFLVLYMYKGRAESLLQFYNHLVGTLKGYNLSATRVFEVLGDHFEKEKNGEIVLSKNIQKIEFQNVSFAYDTKPILRNVNFQIKRGERVAFVGTSGSGKSTIFSLLTGLYPIQKGKIRIDGIDIRQFDKQSLRKHLSLIPQNPYIFHFSVRDNLRLGNMQSSEEELVTICKKAEFYERVLELENGFGTIVGEGGITLSGGERQRLAIARSLLKEADIILFDEATSSLDNITQDKVQTAIYGLNRDKTILIIAHRLSTILNCDKIIVVDDGKIIDIGTHSDLMKRCTKYQQLYQFEKDGKTVEC